ncbi:MAG: DUF4249 domain-containing protein [Prevotella sp.]|nr:DUF4249 domain-containing protein [Prevotella sp.]
MKKTICFLLPVLLLMGCKDDFSADSLPAGRAKLVVYCMPSTTDTTFISVTRSVPLHAYGSRDGAISVADAAITYTVNGRRLPVARAENGLYYVTGAQHIGDRVSIHVEAEGLEPVDAGTEIPQPAGWEKTEVRTVRLSDGFGSGMRDYSQLLATFTDNAATRDYYAVRVKQRLCDYELHAWYTVFGSQEKMVFMSYSAWKAYDTGLRAGIHCDSIRVIPRVTSRYLPILTTGEKLLNPISDIDDDFGFSNDFYGDFYIFNDATINGLTYTLHLNVDASWGVRNWEKEVAEELKGRYGHENGLEVELYHLTPDYYRFLLVLNDLKNNSFAQAGLSQVRPTYSNVVNGLGICAGFSRSGIFIPMGNETE